MSSGKSDGIAGPRGAGLSLWAKALLFTALALAGPRVYAAADGTTAWIGGTSTAWSNAANWDDGVPTQTDVVIFSDAFTGVNQPSMDAIGTCLGISFAVTLTKAVTIGGSSALWIYAWGINTTSVPRTLTLNCPIWLAMDQSWSTGALLTAGGAITFTKSLTITGGTVKLAAAGSQTSGLVLNGASACLQYANAAAVGGPLILINGKISSDSITARTISNTLSISLGSVTIGDTTNSGALTFTGAKTIGGDPTVTSVGGPHIFSISALTLLSGATLTGGGLTISGGFAFGVDRTLTINNTGPVTLSGALDSSAPGNKLTLAGSSTTVTVGAMNVGATNSPLLEINGTGTYNFNGTTGTATGGVTLVAGTVLVGAASPFFASSNLLTLSGGTIRSYDATAWTVAQPLTISGSTTIGDASGGTGVLTFSGAKTISGSPTITFAGNTHVFGTAATTLTSGATLTGGGITVSGGFALDGVDRTLTINNSGIVTLSGALDSSAPGNKLTLAGTSTTVTVGAINVGAHNSPLLEINGTGTYRFNGTTGTATGGVKLVAGSVRVAAASPFFAATNPVTLSGGVICSDDTTARTVAQPLAINGSVTIGDATKNGALTFSGAKTISGTPTVTIPASMGTVTFSTGTMTLSSAAAFANNSSSVFTFSGAIAYTNQLTLSAGTFLFNNTGTGTGGLKLDGSTAWVQVANVALGGSGNALTLNNGKISSDSVTARSIANCPLAITGSVTIGDATNTGALTFSNATQSISNNPTLTFAGGTHVFGSFPVTLTSGATLAGTAVTMSGGFALDGVDRTLTINNTGAVTLSGALDSSAPGNKLTLAGSSTTVTVGAINVGAHNSPLLEINGTGIYKFNQTTGTASGGVKLVAGTVLVGAASPFFASSNLLTLSGGVISSDTTTARTVAQSLAINGSVTIGDATKNGGLTFSGANQSVTGNSTVTLAGGNVTFSTGALSLDPGSNTTFSSGGPTLTMSGGFKTNGGTSTLTFNTAGIAVTLSGAFSGASPGTLELSGSGTNISIGNLTGGTADALKVNGTGTFTLTGTTSNYAGGTKLTGGGIVIINSNTIALGTGGVTLDNVTFKIHGNGNWTVNNAFYLTGNSMIIMDQQTNGNSTFTLTGTLNVSGTPSLRLQNTIGGATTFNFSEALNLANGANLTVAYGGGAISASTLAGGGINLSGNATITTIFAGANNLTITGLLAGSGPNQILTLAGTAGSKLTVGTLTAGGNNPGLTKAGAWALTLTTANTYGGPTRISGGSLTLSTVDNCLPSGTALRLDDVSGAVLNLNGKNQTVASLNGGGTTGGNVTLGAGTLTVNGTAGSMYDGVISGTGALIEEGGTFQFSNTLTYSGTTTVSGGTLIVNGNLDRQASAVTISSGATLGGNGSIYRPVTLNGILSPGTSLGLLTVGEGASPKNVTFSGTGQYLVDVFTYTADVLIVSGNLTLAGATLQIAPGSVFIAQPYTLAYYSGTRSGTFGPVNGLPPGWTVSYSTANQVILNPPPISVTNVSPSSGPLAGGTAVTVTGTDFVSGATVTFGIATVSAVWVNPTELDCLTPPGTAGPVFTVTVTNPGGESAFKWHAYTYLGPAPTVNAVNPNAGTRSGGQNVTVTGSGFETGATVTFDASTVASGFVDGGTLTCVTPPHNPGAVNVTVTNPYGYPGTLATGYTFFEDWEGDVAPRETGGDGAVSIADWVQIGRFAAALDTVVNGLEFQKADCAARETQGEGVLGIADWVQAGRYAAALDASQPVGGPTAPTP